MAVGPEAVHGTRRWVSRMVSLVLHAGALLVAANVIPHRPAPTATRVLIPTPIEIVSPPEPTAPAPAGAGLLVADKPTGDAGKRARHGRDAPKRVQARAPRSPDGFAELSVHYDIPTSPRVASAGGTADTGLGLGIASAGAGEIGAGGLNVPPAPSAGRSLARPARSKFPYDRWSFLAPPQFIGSRVVVAITIDPHGNVRKVRVVHSVDPGIDRRAAAAASTFEFHPALDDDGQPVWGQVRWEFVITDPSP